MHFSEIFDRPDLSAGYIQAPHLTSSHLINYDVVGVDFELGQLLDQPLRLVEGQELRDANAHEGGFVRVLELVVDLVDDLLQLHQLAEHVVFRSLQVKETRERK